MKKFSLITNDAVRSHLANNSPAKVTHAFPKAKRFGNKNPEYPRVYSDVNKLTTVRNLHYPPYRNARVALDLVKDLISPRTP